MKNCLITIGISNYADDKIIRLDNSVKDSLAVKMVLEEKYQFPPENNFSLFDEEATRHGILSIFNELRKEQFNNLILYYSGHTLIDSKKNNECILPFDSDVRNPLYSSISFREIITIVRYKIKRPSFPDRRVV